MKILSIDVGIKNLAFCLFEKSVNSDHFKIKKWDVVNVSEQEVYNCCFLEKNVICNKPAKFEKNNQCFCLKHSKKQDFSLPSSECKPTFISKQSFQKLYAIADKYGIPYTKPIKKADLVILINEYIQDHFFKAIEPKNASKVDLIDIGINIKYKFNALFSNEECIDYVIIENQISPIANRMKTIQGMIVQYFIMADILVPNFEFISASNKLKDVVQKGDNVKYSERKKMGIAKCLEIITTNHCFCEHLTYFNSHKKKDDLSDSFLQGLWFINNRNLTNI
jgi:hypothetical protein